MLIAFNKLHFDENGRNKTESGHRHEFLLLLAMPTGVKQVVLDTQSENQNMNLGTKKSFGINIFIRNSICQLTAISFSFSPLLISCLFLFAVHVERIKCHHIAFIETFVFAFSMLHCTGHGHGQ